MLADYFGILCIKQLVVVLVDYEQYFSLLNWIVLLASASAFRFRSWKILVFTCLLAIILIYRNGRFRGDKFVSISPY